MARHNEIGKLGEDIATKFVKNKGFIVLERNYRKKWGEIDIIAKKDSLLHFIEVKSVSRENFNLFPHKKEKMASNSANDEAQYNPLENLHPQKLKRLSRVTQSYVIEKCSDEQEWEFNVITIIIDTTRKTAECKLIEDILL